MLRRCSPSRTAAYSPRDGPEEALTSETLTKLYGVGMAVCPVTAAGKSFSVAVVTGGKTQ